MNEITGLVISRDRLEEWAGRKLTDAEVATLSSILPHSSLPDVIGTVVEGMENG